jgi:hypothetical protein
MKLSTNLQPYALRSSSGRGRTGQNYQTIIEVELRHGYYNASQGKCPDFSIVPTSTTASLMRSFGLLFKATGASFSVLADRNRMTDLFRYLESQELRAKQHSSLTFLLVLRNPYFVPFTEMPVNHSPSLTCYYFSNVYTMQEKSGEAVLNPDFPGEPALRLTGSQYEDIVYSHDVKCVTLQNTAGEVVLCKNLTKDTARPQSVFLDLSSLANGRYTVGESNAKCELINPESIQQKLRIIYALSSRSPFCMVDLLLCGPDAAQGVYPVSQAGVVEPMRYVLQFQPRKTTWNYYVVSAGAPLQDLKIVQQPDFATPTSVPPVTFSGPVQVTLPTQQLATQFVSQSPIPLLQQSTYHFQLRGKIGFQEVRNGVLMERLPVANNRQVIPGESNFATRPREFSSSVLTSSSSAQIFSDIYVYV